MSNAWQYYVLKGMSRIISLLPYSRVLSLGNTLGNLYYRIAARQRQRALSQMRDCLDISAEAAEKTVVSVCRKLGQTFLEVLYSPALTSENIQDYVTIENRHYLDQALSDGKGVVLLTAHIGNWEWLGASLAMAGFPLTGVAKRQPNDQHTRILNENRQRAGIEIFSRGTTEVIGAARALKQGKIVALLADQDAGSQGLFVEFFGKMSSTPLGPTIFAKKFKSPVVPAFIVRRPEGGHRVILHEPMYYQDTGKTDEDIYSFTTQTTKIIEDTIRQYPDEWIWFQKRWNTIKPEERMGEQA
ncbi:MAG: lysophospholipid acyltransferase family protein [Sporomusaceae bacterium]|nr:lysophospholipid acyltransferase family protein [Sporomusaceae bacterium]